MQAEPDGDFFLCAAMEWMAFAERASPPDPRLVRLARELVSCHTQFVAGQYAAVLAQLRTLTGATTARTGMGREPDRAEAIAVAADLLDTLRLRLNGMLSS